MDQRRTEARLAKIQLRQATDNKELAQLEMMRAQEILKRRTIESPIDGVVMERFKVVGEYVEEKPVVRIAKIDPLHVEVIVPVQQLGKIQKGMHAEVWSETVEGETWKATVSRVDSVADVASGTYGVRLVMPNPEHKIPAGLRCRMQLVEAPPEPAEEQTAELAQPEVKEPIADVAAQEKPVAMAPLADTVPQKTPAAEPVLRVAEVKQAPKAQVEAEVKKAVVDKPEPLVASLDAEARRVRVALPDLRTGSGATSVTKEKAPSDQIKPIRRFAASKRLSADVEPAHKESAKTPDAISKAVAEPRRKPLVSVTAATPKAVETGKQGTVEPVNAPAVQESVVAMPVTVPEVVEAKKEIAAVTASAAPECRLAGPYSDEVAATRKIVQLREAGLYADIKSVNTYKRAGYKIVTPLQKSRADMNAIAARLKAAGFTDYYVPRKKSSPKRVILGLYKGKRMAQIKIDRLTEKGFTAELQPWKKKESQHYLVIRGVPSTADGDLLADLPVPDNSGESTQSFCNHLAGR
jgi:hypothetical protein